jgi:hypothetical protein
MSGSFAVGFAAAIALAAPAAAAGAWGSPQVVGAGGSDDGRVAVDAFGNVGAVWSRGARLMIARRPPGGVFSAPKTVAVGLREHESDPAVAILPRGEVAIAWTDRDWRVHARWGRVGGRLGRAQVIGAGIMPQLAVDGRGTFLLTWKGPPGAHPSTVEVAERPLGGRFGARQTLGTTRGRPELEAAVGGHAALLWLPEGGGGDWLAMRSPQGGWGPGERVPVDDPSLSGLGLGIDATGTVFVAGSSFQPGPPFRSALVRREVNGFYHPQESFEADGVIRDLAVEPSGATSFILGRPAGGRREVDLEARVRDAAGVLGSPQFLHDRANVTGMVAGARGGVLAVLAVPGAVKVTEHADTATVFDAPLTLGSGEVYGGTPALAASGAAAVAWYEGAFEAARWRVAVRDAPAGIRAAAAAHVEAFGSALEPVADIGAVPRLTADARAVRIPVTCSESCAVVATVIAGGRGARVARPLAPGRRRVLRVPLTRTLRGREALRYSVRARGYSRRVATFRGTIRIASRP